MRNPVAQWLVHRASVPQVRGANPELGKNPLAGASRIEEYSDDLRSVAVRQGNSGSIKEPRAVGLLHVKSNDAQSPQAAWSRNLDSGVLPQVLSTSRLKIARSITNTPCASALEC
ncbi:hypothetical protein TNCV_183201 [Trichonephila clavipes]|nr:hypothetical protein TNCV_183201 [Trichonephila clavipes]